MTIKGQEKINLVFFLFLQYSLFLHIIFYSLPRSLAAQFDNVQVFVDDQPVTVVAVDGVVDVLGGGEEGRRVGRVQRVFYQPAPRFRRQGSRGGRRGCRALGAPAPSAAWTAASAAAAARAAGCQLPHKLLVHLGGQ